MKNLNINKKYNGEFDGYEIVITSNEVKGNSNLIIKLITGAVIGFVNGF